VLTVLPDTPDVDLGTLGIVTAAARDAGVAIPLGATAAQLMGALRAQGNGGPDHSALHMLIETLPAVGRREGQPCRRAGLAATATQSRHANQHEAVRHAYLPEQRPLSA